MGNCEKGQFETPVANGPFASLYWRNCKYATFQHRFKHGGRANEFIILSFQLGFRATGVTQGATALIVLGALPLISDVFRDIEDKICDSKWSRRC